MATTELIAATEFCTYHHIEHAFITSLEDAGLVHLMIVDEQKFIPYDQLQQLERMIRLHQELEINIEGIATIVDMLGRMQHMQDEITQLRNRLRFYEQL